MKINIRQNKQCFFVGLVQKLPSEKVNSDTDLSSGDPLTDGHVSTSHVHRQAIAILLALFERYVFSERAASNCKKATSKPV